MERGAFYSLLHHDFLFNFLKYAIIYLNRYSIEKFTIKKCEDKLFPNEINYLIIIWVFSMTNLIN